MGRRGTADGIPRRPFWRRLEMFMHLSLLLLILAIFRGSVKVDFRKK
jgi:hypothetical protein